MSLETGTKVMVLEGAFGTLVTGVIVNPGKYQSKQTVKVMLDHPIGKISRGPWVMAESLVRAV